MNTKIRAVQCDITTIVVDAIVNAANPHLGGGDPVGLGGGVDGAIHRAAGPELLEACRPFGGCKVGDAVITPAFNLPSRYVIHTVGPRWSGGDAKEAMYLASCYRRVLSLAQEHACRSIALPCISTGTYGYPLEQAIDIALTSLQQHMQENPGGLDEIIFCCFSKREHDAYSFRLPADASQTW